MNPKRGIKNIIFDLGGVLLNLDYSLTTKALQQIHPDFVSFDAVYSGQIDKQLFEDFETGALSPEQFRDGIRSIIKNNVSNELIDKAWNAMLLDLPVKRLRLLEQLKPDYRLFLLSNTNAIHLKAFSKILLSAFGYADLSHIFEKEYFSNKIGMRKPDKEIFQFVLNEKGLEPADTLFIDDAPQHVKTASEMGIHTHLLKNEEDITAFFNYK
jgi:FMN phosphatase YigB (HAD superfamily)